MRRRILLIGWLLLSAFGLLACVPLITRPMGQTPIPSTHPITEFPLSISDTWIYSGTRYDITPGILFQRITETVVNVTQTVDLSGTALYVAELERTVTPIAVPEDWSGGEDFTVPSQTRFWYILRGDNVYRQDQTLDLSDVISNSQLEFTFPLESSYRWYLNETMRQLNPSFENDSSLRKQVEIGSFESSARLFRLCYLYNDVIGGWLEQTRLCPQVGIVERKGDHQGTPFGLHEVLIDYRIRNGKPITTVEQPMIGRMFGPPECHADMCLEFTDELETLPPRSEKEQLTAIHAIQEFMGDPNLFPTYISTMRDPNMLSLFRVESYQLGETYFSVEPTHNQVLEWQSPGLASTGVLEGARLSEDLLLQRAIDFVQSKNSCFVEVLGKFQPVEISNKLGVNYFMRWSSTVREPTRPWDQPPYIQVSIRADGKLFGYLDSGICTLR